MIISASYRTDIPAFYGEWFNNRLDAGYCMVENTFNRNKPYRVSLKHSDVDGFIFWTKNLAPFVKQLEIIHEKNYPFMVQYTINGYPRELESRVVNTNNSIRDMKMVAEKYGSRVAVWRYDTILFTSLTDADFHRENFEKLAKELEGTTDEVIISFAQIYKKTLKNVNQASKENGLSWEDPIDDVKIALTQDLVQIAKNHNMKLTVCAQNKYVVSGASASQCVDAKRLSDVAGYAIGAKVKGNRPDCACFISRDIGSYDTCPHGCIYCYAVKNRELALKRFRAHDPQSPFLFTDGNPNPYIEDKEINHQPRLF